MSEPGREHRRTWLPVVVLALFHVGLLTRVFPLGVAFSPDPVLGGDYALHSMRALMAGEHFAPHGRLFGLDPFHMSGQVASTVHFLDNKLGELAVALFGPLVGPGRAFNLFVFAAFSSIPAAIVGAARLLRAPWAASLAAGWLASLAFHGASYTANWTLFGGYGFLICSAYAPLAAAALYRHIEDATWRSGLTLLATAPLFYAHGLMPPMTALLGLGFVPFAIRQGPRRLGITLAPVVGIVALNLPWLAPLFADWGTLDSAHVAHVGAADAPLPFVALLRRFFGPHFYGLSLPIVLGAAGLTLLWRRDRRTLAMSVGGAAAVIVFAAFDGTRSEFVAAMIEPRRLKVTIPLVLAFPGGLALHHWGARCIERFGLRCVLVGGAVFAVLTLPLTVMPLATRAFGTARLGTSLPAGGERVLAAVESLGDPRGRLAFEERGPKPKLGYMAAIGPTRTKRAWTGGPYYRAITGRRASQLANGKIGLTPLGELSDAEILHWMDLFDVTAVAVTTPEGIERFRALGDALVEVGAEPPYVLFEARRAADALLEGEGTVEYDYDRVIVTPEGPDDVVVKLHWNHRLAVEGAEALREEVPGVPVGFIRVRGHGGKRFEIRVAGWF